MSIKQKKAIINFKKSQSLLGKIISMMENNNYCIDIMQQNLAVMGLLKSAHHMLLENHLDTCFKNAMNSKNAKLKAEMVDEIKKISKYASKFSCHWSLDASNNN